MVAQLIGAALAVSTETSAHRGGSLVRLDDRLLACLPRGTRCEYPGSWPLDCVVDNHARANCRMLFAQAVCRDTITWCFGWPGSSMAKQHADDRNDDQQLDERETA